MSGPSSHHPILSPSIPHSSILISENHHVEYQLLANIHHCQPSSMAAQWQSRAWVALTQLFYSVISLSVFMELQQLFVPGFFFSLICSVTVNVIDNMLKYTLCCMLVFAIWTISHWFHYMEKLQECYLCDKINVLYNTMNIAAVRLIISLVLILINTWLGPQFDTLDQI